MSEHEGESCLQIGDILLEKHYSLDYPRQYEW